MAYTDIDKPSDYFETVLYTGNGGTQSITSLDFAPALCWFKSRTTTDAHAWYDSVRGATKRIKSNSTDAETTQSTALTSFNSDGFSIGAGGDVNTNNATYASWNFKANGAGSANTDGSISSTVSANTTSGFSIVTVANVGSANFTFGHGLGVAPSWVLAKSRDGGKWNNYFKSLGAGYTIQLPEAAAKISNTAIWQNTNPTSSVVYSNGGQLDANESYVFYCFAPKQGYSKFGSYVGNGSGTDGTFVYTGFLPSFIMFKSTSTTGGWEIHDNKRDTFNVSSKRLFPNLSNAEATEDYVDFVSNGFKFRTGDANGNTNGTSYIYMAFAENPFVTSTGVPATAR